MFFNTFLIYSLLIGNLSSLENENHCLAFDVLICEFQIFTHYYIYILFLNNFISRL